MTPRGPRLGTDVVAGLLFMALGAGFLFLAVQLPPGPPRRLGPGSFPTLIASLMIGVGALVAIVGWLKQTKEPLALDWPKLGIIVAALAVFALLLRGAGLIVATAALVVIASRAHPLLSLRLALLLGLGLGAFSAVLFVALLRLPMPAIGPWLGG